MDFFPLPPFSSFPLSLATRSNNARKKSPPPPPPRDYLTRVKTPLRITPTIDRFGSKEGRGEGDKVASETKIKQKKDQFFSPPLFSSPLPSRLPAPPPFPPPFLPPSLEGSVGGVRARNTRPRVSLSSHSRGNKRGAYGSRHILRPHFYFDTNSHVVSTASMTRVRPIVLIPTRYCPYKSPETRAQDVSSAPHTHTYIRVRTTRVYRSVFLSPPRREGKERSRIQYGVVAPNAILIYRSDHRATTIPWKSWN